MDSSPGKDAPFQSMTFVGGSADCDDLPSAADEVASTGGGQMPLSMASVGVGLWVAKIQGGHRLVRRLTDLGIVQGSEITVVSRTASGSVVVGLQGCRLGLGAGMAHRVMVTSTPLTSESREMAAPPIQADPGEGSPVPLTLGALSVGQSGQILGYEKGHRGYREKLLSMGLTPGTHFTITRQAPLGDPIEIEVRGFKLSLRKGEAAALQVEQIEG